MKGMCRLKKCAKRGKIVYVNDSLRTLKMRELLFMGRGPKRIVTEKEAWCSGCKKMVLHIDFSTDNSSKDRLDAYCKGCKANKWRPYYKSNAQKFLDYQRTRNYGITSEEYKALWDKQGGMCASCGMSEIHLFGDQVKRLAVDHCHITGKVRELLCKGCNTALGSLQEDPQKIMALLRYVEKHKG